MVRVTGVDLFEVDHGRLNVEPDACVASSCGFVLPPVMVGATTSDCPEFSLEGIVGGRHVQRRPGEKSQVSAKGAGRGDQVSPPLLCISRGGPELIFAPFGRTVDLGVLGHGSGRSAASSAIHSTGVWPSPAARAVAVSFQAVNSATARWGWLVAKDARAAARMAVAHSLGQGALGAGAGGDGDELSSELKQRGAGLILSLRHEDQRLTITTGDLDGMLGRGSENLG